MSDASLEDFLTTAKSSALKASPKRHAIIYRRAQRES